MEEEDKGKEDEEDESLIINKIENKTDRKELNLKLSDRESLLNKSHLTQNPEDALYNKNNNNKINLEKFKNMFKNKKKELNEYKETLDKKIELLKNKAMNSKGRNINTIIEKPNSQSTIKESNEINENNIINEKAIKKNFEESLIFKLKKDNKNNNIHINYNKFKKEYSKYNNLYILLSLLNNNDIYRLFNINKEFRKNIIELLVNKIKEKIIPKFIAKYCNGNLFDKDSYHFILVRKKKKKNKKTYIRIILNIKAKICENNLNIINKKHQISYQILNPFDLIKSTFTSYSFEIIPKLIPKKFWIYKEYTTFHYDDFNKAYYNDLLQFWPGDEILISIGLINELGILDFDNFHWLNPKNIPKIKKNKLTDILLESYLTNSENTCEVEGIIKSWIGIEQLENNINVMNTLKELFGNNFEVLQVFYEDIGYYFFKIILEAKNEGECSGVDNNLGINIKIYNTDKHICNEVKKNGLIYDENNELSVNINDIITFYISQNK